MQEKTIIKNLEQLENFASEFVKKLSGSDNKATIIGLYGELGSGKTAFVKKVAKRLAVVEKVTSPTFVIEKFYNIQGKENNFDTLIHIDAYRLESGSELIALGWNEQVSNPKNLIIIEWPERVAEILPNKMNKLYFKFVDEETREIES